MLDDLLPTTVQPIAIAVLGVLAGIMGLTGMLRRETSVLNPTERQTALGRLLTLLLSTLWLLVGIFFLLSLVLPGSLREDLIGFTSVIVSVLHLLFLLLLLTAAILTREPLPKSETVRVMESVGRDLVSALSEPRFQRLDTVLHPDYGHGRILAIYKTDGRKMVAARFANVVRSVPAVSLRLRTPEDSSAAAATTDSSLSSIKIEIEQLEFLLSALEAQRGTLGTQALEIGMKPLRDKLVKLIFMLEQESLVDSITMEQQPLQAQIDNLQDILAGLEAQRNRLGNQTLEIGMKPLRDRLVALVFAREQELLADQILSQRGPLQEQIDDMEELLATLESQRETLGDQAMEITMKPLRDKLVALVFARERDGLDSPHPQ